MLQLRQRSLKPSDGTGEVGYDSGVVKVIAFASSVIVFSMLLVGTIVYLITEDEAVGKLKSRDLHFIAQSVGVKVDAIISRAVETSVNLSRDPAVIDWLVNEEKDPKLSEYAAEKLNRLSTDFGYSSTFVVSALTRHYWAESKQIIDTVTEDDPTDAWFFKVMAGDEPITVMLDYNKERNDTFVFVDVLMKEGGRKLGSAGVGLSLKDLSEEFTTYKFGSNSNLWLVDRSGTIYLSDQVEHNGRNVASFLPGDMVAALLQPGMKNIQVGEYVTAKGEKMDLVGYPLESGDLVLVYNVPRSENVAFLRKIKINTIIATVISLVAVVILFFYISRKLANPYKRALELNRELELKVQERTKELAEHNRNMTDSIAYAMRIQQSLLPAPEQMSGYMKEHFIIWEPRDMVGGDFYWGKPVEGGYLVAIGDCTGHGVPGALMTVLAISLLDQIAEHEFDGNPAAALGSLHKQVKLSMRQQSPDGMTDDGLDLGLCYVTGDRLVFAGAGCSLFVMNGGDVEIVKGNSKSIGYRRIPDDYAYTQQEFPLGGTTTFYLSTDGCFDQNGGLEGHSFGKKRFVELLRRLGGSSLDEQKRTIAESLREYRADKDQRDDITVMGFKP